MSTSTLTAIRFLLCILRNLRQERGDKTRRFKPVSAEEEKALQTAIAAPGMNTAVMWIGFQVLQSPDLWDVILNLSKHQIFAYFWLLNRRRDIGDLTDGTEWNAPFTALDWTDVVVVYGTVTDFNRPGIVQVLEAALLNGVGPEEVHEILSMPPNIGGSIHIEMEARRILEGICLEAAELFNKQR